MKVQRLSVDPKALTIKMPFFTTILSAQVELGTLVVYGLTDSPAHTNKVWTECKFQLFKTGEACLRISAITDPCYVFVDTVNYQGEVLHLFVDHNFTDKKAYI